MIYIVTKPFQDITGFKQVGDPVELDDGRAAKLRRMGLIAGRYEQPIRTAVIIEPELREAVVKTKKGTAKKLK